MTIKNLSSEEIDRMVSLYLSGKTAHESGKAFGVSYKTCLRELHKREIATRNKTHYRKYEICENVFETIDTEHKAYWLGFIAADGAIIKNSLSIRLCEKDIDHLYKFKKFISSSHSIKKYKSKSNGKEYPSCSISICSKKLLEDLSKLNIAKNKTKTFNPPEKIPNHLVAHFWRGFFDGDGCISSSIDPKRNKFVEKFRVSLVGNYDTIKKFEEYIKSLISTQATIKKVKNKDNYYFEISGNNKVKKILSMIYNNPNIYLDRKFDKVLKCQSAKIIRKNKSNES